MSALTDFFTSLANKIRSKLGTNTTYTPAQAVSAIDDVYNKGVGDTKVGTAGVGDVVSGKTFTNSTTVGATGTFAAQEKTVTAGTSASSVTPDSGKWLSKVTYNPTPSQTKSTTSSRSAQTISPDSGKLLSSVSIAKYPDASGTFTPTSAQYNTSAADMGTTNNLRYVNTSVCYLAGQKSANAMRMVLQGDHGGTTICQVPFPSLCKGIKITGISYGAGSYASGDEIGLANSSWSSYSALPLNSCNGKTISITQGAQAYINMFDTGAFRQVDITIQVVY